MAKKIIAKSFAATAYEEMQAALELFRGNLEVAVKSAGVIRMFPDGQHSPVNAVMKGMAQSITIYALKYDGGLQILTDNSLANYSWDHDYTFDAFEDSECDVFSDEDIAELNKIIETGDYFEYLDDFSDEMNIDATIQMLTGRILDFLE